MATLADPLALPGFCSIWTTSGDQALAASSTAASLPRHMGSALRACRDGRTVLHKPMNKRQASEPLARVV
jgi:hypothetical protein